MNSSECPSPVPAAMPVLIPGIRPKLAKWPWLVPAVSGLALHWTWPYVVLSCIIDSQGSQPWAKCVFLRDLRTKIKRWSRYDGVLCPAFTYSFIYAHRSLELLMCTRLRLWFLIYVTVSFPWLVQVEIHSGRPHQIRIHLAYIGHPLVGKPKHFCYCDGHDFTWALSSRLS